MTQKKNKRCRKKLNGAEKNRTIAKLFFCRRKKLGVTEKNKTTQKKIR
jgi:hypothetical protein